MDGPRKSFAGGAGLVSTARDYARFLEMIRNGGALDGVRILAPRTVALMTTNQIGTLKPTPGLGFGLGFETTDRYGANGLSSVGTFGWGGAYGSSYRVDPDARLTLVFMIQLIPNRTDVAQKFPNLVYQALMDAPRVGLTLKRASVDDEVSMNRRDFARLAGTATDCGSARRSRWSRPRPRRDLRQTARRRGPA